MHRALIPLGNDIREVELQGFGVGVWARVDALGEVEEEGSEAGGGEVDFLVVGDLANRAVEWGRT